MFNENMLSVVGAIIGVIVSLIVIRLTAAAITKAFFPDSVTFPQSKPIKREPLSATDYMGRATFVLTGAGRIISPIFWGVVVGMGFVVLLWLSTEQPNVDLFRTATYFVAAVYFPFYQAQKRYSWIDHVLLETSIAIVSWLAFRSLPGAAGLSAIIAVVIVWEIGTHILMLYSSEDEDDAKLSTPAKKPSHTAHLPA
jgi:hypothetical protein